MSLPHRSVATIDAPEFINLQPLDINPMMSECEIKVMYIGENRNQSFISKETALEMAKTLRGAPIVGYYSAEKEDFRDHGEKVTIDGDGVHFECQTRPYGFVSPVSDVWFQKFDDTDEFGNVLEREYLMTKGFLWTGQYPEIQDTIDNARPQSMELENVDGHWATNAKSGLDLFIINDAVVSKLCILGNDVEPCFEGAAVATSFSLDNKFNKTLFSMMEDLKAALKGESAMDENEIKSPEQVEEVTEPVVEETVEEVTPEVAAEVEEVEEPIEIPEVVEEEPVAEEHLHTDAEYAELESKLAALQADYDKMSAEREELLAFRANIENKEKDALIASFDTLTEEDKQEVIANKENYTCDEIESKLAVLCYRKKVNFSLVKDVETPVTTVDVNSVVEDRTPEWLKAVLEHENKN